MKPISSYRNLTKIILLFPEFNGCFHVEYISGKELKTYKKFNISQRVGAVKPCTCIFFRFRLNIYFMGVSNSTWVENVNVYAARLAGTVM